jgi:type II secretory ATPase GspE/PulE/Tfp pilus assembly ATPase PilB-like protein
VDIERFIKGESPRIDLPADITPLIKTLRGKLREVSGGKMQKSDDPELVQAADLILALGVASNATDIHLAPQMTEAGRQPETILRLRIDGVLHSVSKIDNRLLSPIIDEFKRRADKDVRVKDRPQDGQILSTIPCLKGKPADKVIDFRLLFLPTGLGESMTLRILNSDAVTISLDAIGFPEADRSRIDEALRTPWGLIVLSGPTGSGKTTVLYSCLREITGPQVKTVSVEDPIEYYLPWVNQVAVNPSAGVTFSAAVKAVFKTDPDIIAIGEIRDLETLTGALQAALTGHLVLTQLHAPTAVRALFRMTDIGVDPFMVTEATRLIVAQRLVRKLCENCSEQYKPTATELDKMKSIARDGGLDWKNLKKNFRRPVGCDKCTHTGYRRRDAIVETLRLTPEIARAVSNNDSLEEIKKLAISLGMTTLAADGVRKAASGVTTIDEVLRVLGQNI